MHQRSFCDHTPGKPDTGDTPPSLALVQALNLDGCFVTNTQMVADASSVYLASVCTRKLFIVGRDPSHAVETVPLPALADSVAVDDDSIFVGLVDETILVLRKDAPHEGTVHAAGARSSGLFPRDGKLYAGTWQSRVAVTEETAFLMSPDPGHELHEIDLETWTVSRSYITTLRMVPVAFDRVTGDFLGSLPNLLVPPGTLSGTTLRADDEYVFEADPGCCPQGIVVYDRASLTPVETIARPWASDAIRRGRWLFGGTWADEVVAWDFAKHPAVEVASINLRTATGHAGIDGIRVVWADGYDDLVFAGAVGGDDQSRGPDLPTFFILR